MRLPWPPGRASLRDVRLRYNIFKAPRVVSEGLSGGEGGDPSEYRVFRGGRMGLRMRVQKET